MIMSAVTIMVVMMVVSAAAVVIMVVMVMSTAAVIVIIFRIIIKTVCRKYRTDLIYNKKALFKNVGIVYSVFYIINKFLFHRICPPILEWDFIIFYWCRH